MKSIIIGGGKVGFNLLKTLKERGFEVTLIERNRELCHKIAEDFDTDVICGDGTNLEVLKDAGIEDADIIAAVTGTDEENLVICQIAKLSFNIKKTIARVNYPKNTIMFKKLGIDNTVCSTKVIADLIEFSLDEEDYHIINFLEKGARVLAELSVKDKHPWSNKQVRELRLPEECVLVSILRGDSVIYPKGDTEIKSNDKVVIITNRSVLSNLVTELYDRR